MVLVQQYLMSSDVETRDVDHIDTAIPDSGGRVVHGATRLLVTLSFCKVNYIVSFLIVITNFGLTRILLFT